MSWASRKQFKYISFVVIIIVFIIFMFIRSLIIKEPTCFDLKQNGNERGVDCGGSCSLMCKMDVSDPNILWSRAFPVTGNTYNLLAYVENRNKDAGVISTSYEFRVYDTNNKLLGRREGKTFIPPNQQFPIFEPRFDSGESKIKSVTFEFTSPFVWLKKDPTLQTLEIRVNNIILDENRDTPTLTANISNNSIHNLPEFDAVAILYDEEGNAINASKTHKDKLISGGSLPLMFTWPEALTLKTATKDIMILIDPFSVSF